MPAVPPTFFPSQRLSVRETAAIPPVLPRKSVHGEVGGKLMFGGRPERPEMPVSWNARFPKSGRFENKLSRNPQ